ncbi:aspartyl-phosphate phosphatase Spo0E family protein [Niallia taxi]|nr:aspartyl-phosphate phosphatase Spo0E family protein [Niallia taxi]MDE5055018.1 aspartyl-phosphate phosphatase Spo0E family protein [Niallia taxi]
MPNLSRENEDIKELLRMIDHLRSELVKTASNEGFSSPNTIRISQILDSYLVEYQRKMTDMNK